jgi:hypothetical protein
MGIVEVTGLRDKALNIFEREDPSPSVSSNLGALTSHETLPQLVAADS